jgi:undecaprenyl diphosphate synthase
MNNNETKQIECVGLIMDGNRRFAKIQGQEKFWGHLMGKEKMFEVIKWIREENVPHAVFYAFSTENWKREKSEVDNLMNLFTETVKALKDQYSNENICFRIIGRRSDFSPTLTKAINDLESVNEGKVSDLTVWIALSYGGRAEIVAAVNEAIKKGVEVTEDTFSKMLWSGDMLDPDIIIRTGGDRRLSNFLTWQSVYSELFFSETLWPAFTKDEFTSILNEYATRERRIGK